MKSDGARWSEEFYRKMGRVVSVFEKKKIREERKIKKLIHNQLVAYELEKEFSEVFIEITPYGKWMRCFNEHSQPHHC